MLRIFCGDDLAERAAGVVPDESDWAESKRRQKVRNQTGQPERAEIRIRVERHVVRAERPVGYYTVVVFGESWRHFAPQGAIHHQTVHKHDRRAGSKLAVTNRPLWNSYASMIFVKFSGHVIP